MTSGVVRTDNPYLAALVYQYRSLMPETYQMPTNDYHENLMDFVVCCDYLEAKIEVMQGMMILQNRTG